MKVFAYPGLLFLALSVGITSCSIVGSKQIVGGDPVDDDAGIGGHWMDADGEVVTVSFDEKYPGRLHLTSESEELASALCYVRQTGDWMFLNLSWEPEDGEERVWIWWVANVLNEGEDVLLWRPDPEHFAKLVRANKIAGSVVEQKFEKNVVEGPDGRKETVNVLPGLTVTIDDPEGKWVGELVAGKLGMPIDWQNPTLWRRVDAAGPKLPRNDSQDHAEQGGAGRSATAPESKPEGNEKPNPESEVRPQ